MPHINLHITGKVQGVFYRDSTRKKAQELGVAGFVRNEPDGSVYAEAEGSNEALDALVQWCQRGPENARVDKLTVTKGEMAHYQGFEIRR